jgi:hypothetical protein
MLNTTETGKPIVTMGEVQTNADRHVVAMLDFGIVHYSEDCAVAALMAADWLTTYRQGPSGWSVKTYETTIRGGDTQRRLRDLGYDLLTRQDLALRFSTPPRCAACGKVIE